ncbi:MAG TPA: MBL fold metallo-hydrolase [Bryobacteraceae bacterium]|nr:MBL fold metallo-hydrolase [Bryobacteraceae bacterium]
MRIVILENSGQVYTSQVYLVLGDASRMKDLNTLVDVGQDPAVLASIERAPTGVGKWPVEQVVLTHSHSDHCALLPRIRAVFDPKVFAFSPNIDGVDCVLSDGDTIKMGDEYFEVIHTPGHSSDSICLYNQAEGVLFAGDTPLLIASPNGTYEPEFLAALEKLCTRDVRRMYFGHGAPLTERCNERLRESQRMAAAGSSAVRKQERIKNLAPVMAQ